MQHQLADLRKRYLELMREQEERSLQLNREALGIGWGGVLWCESLCQCARVCLPLVLVSTFCIPNTAVPPPLCPVA